MTTSNPFFRNLFFLSITFILFASCEIEPYRDDAQLSTNIIEEFQAKFSLKNFEDPSGHITENIEVNWNNYTTKLYDDKLWFEFQIIENRPKSYSKKGELRGEHFTLLAHKEGSRIKLYINKMLATTDGDGFTYFSIQEKYYGGMVYLYNLMGEVEHLSYFEKGDLIRTIADNNVNEEENWALGLSISASCHEKANVARCDSALQCALDGGANGDSGSCGGGGGGYVTVTTFHFTDWYNNRGSYSDYSHTTYDGSTTELVWVSSDSSSGWDSGYSEENTGYANTNPDGYTTYSDKKPRNAIEDPYKVVKDVSLKQYPCAANIIGELTKGDFKKLSLDNLGNLNSGSHLSQTILNLFENSKNYHLNFKVGDLNYANASTLPKANTPSRGEFTFYITLDKDFINNATSLVVARTLIHESLHAYLSHMYQNMPNSSFSNLLRNYLTQQGVTTNDAQHRLMTQYADAIGYSLSVWDSHRLPRQYYNDLGWSGDMLSTNEFNMLSNSRQTAIRNANIAEGSAAQKATNNAKGIQCN